MKLRVISLGLLAAAVLTLILVSHKKSTAACSLPACDLERTFFSDSTFTEEVGAYHITCYGTNVWGVRSNYYDHIEYGECGYGYGTCSGVDFTCSDGTIIWASVPGYVGQPCARYVQ